MNKTVIAIILLGFVCPAGAENFGPNQHYMVSRSATRYENSRNCVGCHPDTFNQFNVSQHSKAFTDPLFQTQYFREIVPLAKRNPIYRAAAKRCIQCHSPVLFMSHTGMIHVPSQASSVETGITCDFCHTFAGFAENGDYLSEPSGKKQGPYEMDSIHGEKNGALSASEFCAYCHNLTNHNDLEIMGTFTEWKKSSRGKKLVTCQECHMSKNGYGGGFERGPAAYLQIGFSQENKAPIRDKLFSHLFPGSHSQKQLQGAAAIEASLSNTMMPDGKRILNVQVINSRSGHRLPTGQTDLRMVWLEVTASTASGDPLAVRHLKSPGFGKEAYGFAGSAEDDVEVIGTIVPRHSRVYRTVFADEQGNRALSATSAKSVLFDNRLNPDETRNEKYVVSVPLGYTGPVTIQAKLSYLLVPPVFTRSLALPDETPVIIGTLRKEFNVVDPVSDLQAPR
mgnify:CR=1 FL=1